MKLWVLVLLPWALLGAPACGTTTVTAGSECQVFLPVSWSQKDTEKTVIEVKRHNARRKAWCEDR